MKPNKILETAPDVWNYLINDGGLDITDYDRTIVYQLKTKLSIPDDSDIEKALSNIKCETLITAFFEVMEPFSMMMSDIYLLFQEAGAKYSNSNLEVLFNFDEVSSELKFDLNHFKS